MTTLAIVLICAGSVIVLAGLFCLFYFTIIRNTKTSKTVRETVKKYEEAHSLLFGDITKYIHRLEHIASMNLSYSEECATYKRRYSDLCEQTDQTANNVVDQLDGLLDDRKFKEIRAEFAEYSGIINEYVSLVEELNNTLKAKFQEEEDTNSVLIDLGSRLRSLKQTYFAEQSELSLLIPSFEAVFNKINDCFDEANTCIESANYVKANRILRGTVDPIISELTRLIVNLPNMCLSAQSILPDRLSSLRYRYDELLSEGYPLKDIIVSSKFDEYDRQISSIVERLKSFEIDGLQEEIDRMISSFEVYNRALDKEEEANKVFVAEHDEIYKSQEMMENRWVNLCHAIPDIKKIFVLAPIDLEMIETIREKIDISSSTKRTVDTYEHSSNRQPYTALVEKIHELRDQTNDCLANIEVFQNDLVKMKKDIESANTDLPLYWTKAKKAEASIRAMHIGKIEEKYASSVDEIFSLIDELYAKISSVPIDVASSNEIHDKLKKASDSFFENLSKEETDLHNAEDCIVYRNRFRNYPSNSALIEQAESLFGKGEFVRSLEVASSAKDPLIVQDNNL